MTISRFPVGRTAEPRRWGKAGHRLDPREVEERERKTAQRRNEAAMQRARDLDDLERAWRAGEVRPWRITVALDARGLQGPSVDIMCGAQEPDVDNWENGTLYPTVEQLQKLAELAGFPALFFVRPGEPVVDSASLRCHFPKAGPVKEPVLQFSHQALVNAGLRAGVPDEAPIYDPHQQLLF